MKRKNIIDDMDYLRQVSSPIDFLLDDVQGIIHELREYCVNHAVFAMAPVQIGIPKRVIYIKNTANMNNNFVKDYDECIVLINPVIKEAKGRTKFLEGCQSCLLGKDENGLDIYLAGIVERPYSVNVDYYDRDGILHNETFTGFKATVFMHEYDHLDGVLHIDKSLETHKFNTDQMKKYRDNHPIEIINKDAEFDLKKQYKKK